MVDQKNIEDKNEYNRINQNYQIIYAVIFKYGIIFIIFTLSIFLFFSEIKKKIILNYNNTHEEEEEQYLTDFQKKLDDLGLKEELNTNILIKDGFLEISDNVLHSYNNLITFKGLTMPRGTYLWSNYTINDSIKNSEYFENPNYDIEDLIGFMTKIVYVDFNNIQTKNEEEKRAIPLENNNIENTFFISCANDFKIFNLVCNSYIENFLEKYYLYDINQDMEGTINIFKILMGKKYHKEKTCTSLINYIKYTNKAPSQFEDIALLCGGEYLDYFYLVKDFTQVNLELENRYLKPNVSKSKEVNDYKLLSFQQILYNNMENNIPPYEGTYRDYVNYIAALLQKENTDLINSFYLDTTFWFNNFYLIPNLNKLKYQSTQTKREEIESIISSLEKINNGNSIDGYKGLRNMVSNKQILEKEIANLGYTGNDTSGSTNNTTSILLKSIRSLNYIKIINDEVDNNQIKINGYLSINTQLDTKSMYFGAILENTNGSLVVKDFSLNDYPDLNNTIKVIITQKNYSLQEIYQFIQDNIGIYISDNVKITPCDLILDKLHNINSGEYELLLCDEEKVNIIRGREDNKILYQIKMDNYQINSVSATDTKIQNYINENFSGIKTNSITISNVIGKIVSYVPEKVATGQSLQGSTSTIKALDDISTYLGVIVSDIAEEDGKIAAQFSLNNIQFIGIYDPITKKLGPLYLQRNDNKNGLNFKEFSLYLTSENQNEINRFKIETIQYLKGVDEELINIYIND